MDRGAWQTADHRVSKSQADRSDLVCTYPSLGFPGGASGKEPI